MLGNGRERTRDEHRLRHQCAAFRAILAEEAARDDPAELEVKILTAMFMHRRSTLRSHQAPFDIQLTEPRPYERPRLENGQFAGRVSTLFYEQNAFALEPSAEGGEGVKSGEDHQFSKS
jgi:hypothetical protein